MKAVGGSRAALFALLFLWMTPLAQAGIVCTIVANAQDGRVLVRHGDCDMRVTPASTFKLALAAMGYDAGFLKETDAPVLPFREGYPDWAGESWRRDTDPTAWMRHSVVWYSQQIARDLGVETLTRYARHFDYGNGDFSGDRGRDNALERAWIGSSLMISPVEQAVFVRALITASLPIAREAAEKAIALVESHEAGAGWRVWGKTGSAFPRLRDGTLDRARGWGWYVGWARKGGQALVFARLSQDEQRQQRPAGLRAREALLQDWPQLAAGAGR
jgi:beta-lactamase class D